MNELETNIRSMKQRHNREINILKKNCTHEIIDYQMAIMYRPGVFSGNIYVCLTCRKHIKEEHYKKAQR